MLSKSLIWNLKIIVLFDLLIILYKYLLFIKFSFSSKFLKLSVPIISPFSRVINSSFSLLVNVQTPLYIKKIASATSFVDIMISSTFGYILINFSKNLLYDDVPIVFKIVKLFFKTFLIFSFVILIFSDILEII